MHQTRTSGKLVSSCFPVPIRLTVSAKQHILFASAKVAHLMLFPSSLVRQKLHTHFSMTVISLCTKFAMQTHLSKRGEAVAEDVTERNLRELAFDTQKYSGAAIANLVNLAAMRVERDGRDQIRYQDLTDVSRCRNSLHMQRVPAWLGAIRNSLPVQKVLAWLQAIICFMITRMQHTHHMQ